MADGFPAAALLILCVQFRDKNATNKDNRRLRGSVIWSETSIDNL